MPPSGRVAKVTMDPAFAFPVLVGLAVRKMAAITQTHDGRVWIVAIKQRTQASLRSIGTALVCGWKKPSKTENHQLDESCLKQMSLDLHQA